MTAADVSTAARIARIRRGKSATVEETSKMQQGRWMPDVRCQIPEMSETNGSHKPKIHEFLRKFAKNSYERRKIHEKDN
jgi:hypothetical protein